MKRILFFIWLFFSTSLLAQNYIDADGTSAPKWRIGNDRYIELYSDNDSNFVRVKINGIETRLLDYNFVLSKTDSVRRAFNIIGGAANKILYQIAQDSTGFIEAPSNNKYLYYNNGFQWKWAWSPDTTTVVRTSRTIYANAPLRIDGSASADLTANRTLSLLYNPAHFTVTSNQLTANNFTITAGNGLTGGGSLTLGGSATIDLNYNSSQFSIVSDQLTANQINQSADNYGFQIGSVNLGGTFTITVPQDLRTTASPQFNNINLTGMINQQGTGTNYFYGDIQQYGSKSIYNNFVSGWAGSGWRLDYGISQAGKSHFEVDNLTVRGTMSVYELLLNQIRATNGNVITSDAAKVESASGNQITFEDPSNHNVCPFAINDLIIAQSWDNAGTTIRQVQATVTAVSGRTVTVSYNTGTAQKGDTFVRVGNTSNTARQGLVYTVTSDNYAPYIDIINGVNSWSAWSSSTKTKARYGNLAGITDANFGALSGYGLYAQNVYLKGRFYLTTLSQTLEDALNTKVSQTDFNNLSNTVATHTTQIQQNANAITLKANKTYADSLNNRLSTAEANITINANAITTEVTNRTNADNTLQSQITQTANNLNLRVRKDSVISQINISPESVTISSSKLNITGTTTFANGQTLAQAINNGTTTINGGKITTGTITLSHLNFTPVQTTNVIASINASNEGIRISGSKIYIDGTVQFASGYDPSTKISIGGAAADVNNNTTTISGSKIRTGVIQSNNYASGLAGTSFDLTNGNLTFYGEYGSVVLYGATQSYPIGLNIIGKNTSGTNKILVQAGAYNDGGYARYGFSIWDHTANAFLLNVGFSPSLNNYVAKLGNWNLTKDWLADDNQKVVINATAQSIYARPLGSGSSTKYVMVGQTHNGSNWTGYYGISAVDGNNNWLFRIDDYEKKIAGWNFDYQRLYNISGSTGIELSTGTSKTVTTGFAVWNPSSPKMFIGNSTSYMDWNNVMANTLTIAGTLVSSKVSTGTNFNESSGNYAKMEGNKFFTIDYSTYASSGHYYQANLTPYGVYVADLGASPQWAFRANAIDRSVDINGRKLIKFHGVLSSAPTSSLDPGDIYINTEYKVFIYDGSTWRQLN